MCVQRKRDPVAEGLDLSVLRWRRSSKCDNTYCVEVATAPGLVLVRDSANVAGKVLVFCAAEWKIFVSRVRNNDLWV